MWTLLSLDLFSSSCTNTEKQHLPTSHAHWLSYKSYFTQHSISKALFTYLLAKFRKQSFAGLSVRDATGCVNHSHPHSRTETQRQPKRVPQMKA